MLLVLLLFCFSSCFCCCSCCYWCDKCSDISIGSGERILKSLLLVAVALVVVVMSFSMLFIHCNAVN